MGDADPTTPRAEAAPVGAPGPAASGAEQVAAAAAAEPAAWAGVLARWEEPEAHRAYLARFADLDGLAVAGGRYRAVLAERPADAVALAMRDEVLKRATVQGLAQLPRTAPPPAPRTVKGWVVAVSVGLVVALSLLALWLRAGGPPP